VDRHIDKDMRCEGAGKGRVASLVRRGRAGGNGNEGLSNLARVCQKK
jgi:hypothetical protein